MNLIEDFYQKASPWWWAGRQDQDYPASYIHEIVKCVDVQYEQLPTLKENQKGFGLMGYCCQEGVRRNNGRIGSAHGPRAIRTVLGPLSNPLNDGTKVVDLGNLHCLNEDLESTQQLLGDQVANLLKGGYQPLLLGGGHDIAFGNYLGIKRHLNEVKSKNTLGIINLDAHFDLRIPKESSNSGTPFFQISEDLNKEDKEFNYLCMGVQKSSNGRELFETASELGVEFIDADYFHINYLPDLHSKVSSFIEKVDHIYLTVDLDGFSSAFAPGVSAPSPLGFEPNVAIDVIRFICNSGKVISTDIAELNPTYDRDNCTARLAAKLLFQILECLR